MLLRLTCAVLIAFFTAVGSASAIAVGAGENVILNFVVGGGDSSIPFDSISIEFDSGPDLQLSRMDSWEVSVFDDSTGLLSAPALIRVDPFGNGTDDSPLDFTFLRFDIDLVPGFVGESGYIYFSHSAGDFSFGNLIVQLRTESGGATGTPVEVTGIVVLPEPRTVSLISFGLFVLSRRNGWRCQTY